MGKKVNRETASNGGRIVETISSKIVEEDAPWLVGSIIERGTQENQSAASFVFTPVPRPTVLPFPVARHRSYGPHWISSASASGYSFKDNDEDEYSEDNPIVEHDDIDSISSLANPVHRKERKNLDFSKWREIVSPDMPEYEDSGSGICMKAKDESENVLLKQKPTGNLTSRHTNNLISPGTSVKEDNNYRDDVTYDHLQDENSKKFIDDRIGLTQQIQTSRIPEWKEEKIDHLGNQEIQDKDADVQSQCRESMLESIKGHTIPTIEAQIDAENRGRLQNMSPDEIAEAQAEIKEKINPALLRVLQKRGQEKMSQYAHSSLDLASESYSGNPPSRHDKIGHIPENFPSKSSSSSMEDIISFSNRQTSSQGDSVGSSATSRSWNSWSERVEKVRELRFAFDGSAVRDYSKLETGSDNVPGGLGYNAENVAERDFLRTEGDPAAAGYTIKEAIALTRSLIPGQRAIALNLLAVVLDKALCIISSNQTASCFQDSTDWEAVWAFALGPEPELVLSLRLCIDDNHTSVLLACAKAFTCILGCDLNAIYFDVSEKIPANQKDICVAPVFRCKPEMDDGFFGGGFWKYSAKPSAAIFPRQQPVDSEAKEHTIKDDLVVSGQDIAAGLIRMGIIPRIHYLLETDPNRAMEEYLISILIAIARHSPTAASSIMECEQLVETVAKRFTLRCRRETLPYMIKSVILFKVLAKYNKKNCMKLIDNGSFREVTWHLCQDELSLNQWLMIGKEVRNLRSTLMVEQLRFWKVCIQYGYCLSLFQDFLPSFCLWLHPSSFAKLIEDDALYEFACISREAYFVIAALANRFSAFHTDSISMPDSQNQEECFWDDIKPIIYVAIQWLGFKNDPCMPLFFKDKMSFKDQTTSSYIWMISSVMHLLSCILGSAEDAADGGRLTFLSWLPEYVTKVGLELVQNDVIISSDKTGAKSVRGFNAHNSLIAWLSQLRSGSDKETSLASVCCLRGLFNVINSVDNLLQLFNYKNVSSRIHSNSSLRASTILADSILLYSQVEFKNVMITFMKLVTSEWRHIQSIEMFGRGGPAPGIGLGWGASAGGFWSLNIMLTQEDAALLMEVLKTLATPSSKQLSAIEGMGFDIEHIASALQVTLMLLPGNNYVMEMVFDFLFQVPVLRHVDRCIQKFIRLNKGLDEFDSKYTEEDYTIFSKNLSSHYRNRWLSAKNKKSDNEEHEVCNSSLATIHENADLRSISDQNCYANSLIVEWSQQRLPLPPYWYLSSITQSCNRQHTTLQVNSDTCRHKYDGSRETAKAGIFFTLGIETISSLSPISLHFPVQSTPLVWKLHSLSVILLYGFDVLGDQKSRDMYEALQMLYGKLLDEMRYDRGTKFCTSPLHTCRNSVEFLKFQQEIHELYPTFVESVVEQFAALSYGLLFFSRQVAIYLHRNVETTVRVCAWNALSNARVLELLPPLGECIAESQGYLEPVEDNELILEAYTKSWVSGLLDKSVTRKSVAFSLVIHHLSSFIFRFSYGASQLLRYKIARSLLRDCSQKLRHEGMMLELIMYDNPSASTVWEEEEGLSMGKKVERRLSILGGACDGNSSLLEQVGKLKSSLQKNHSLT